MANQYSSSFVILALTMIFIFSLTSSVNGGLFDEVKQGFVDRLCVTQHLDEFQQCFDSLKESYQRLDYDRLKEEAKRDRNTDLDDACCAYLSYRDCIDGTAKKYCGEYAKNTLDSFLATIKGASSSCDEYDSMYKCWDMVSLAGLSAIVLIVVVALVACICVVAKKCC